MDRSVAADYPAEHDTLGVSVPDAELFRAAARSLWLLLAAFPDRGGSDTAVRRRLEGAATAFEAVAIESSAEER